MLFTLHTHNKRRDRDSVILKEARLSISAPPYDSSTCPLGEIETTHTKFCTPCRFMKERALFDGLLYALSFFLARSLALTMVGMYFMLCLFSSNLFRIEHSFKQVEKDTSSNAQYIDLTVQFEHSSTLSLNKQKLKHNHNEMKFTNPSRLEFNWEI